MRPSDRALTRGSHPLTRWPKCGICRWAVSAFGIEDENSKKFVLWARCNGVRTDPQTGEALSRKFHEPRKGYATIKKGPLWDARYDKVGDLLGKVVFFYDPSDHMIVLAKEIQ